MTGIRNATIAAAWRDAAHELIDLADALHEQAKDLEARAQRFLQLADELERPAGAELRLIDDEAHW